MKIKIITQNFRNINQRYKFNILLRRQMDQQKRLGMESVDKQEQKVQQKVYIWQNLQGLAGYNQIEHQKLYSQNLSQDQVNYGVGCMFGAFIGDALGSYCEFRKTIPQGILQQAMTMKSGGTFGIKAGQFTDDSQMASHLLQALNNVDFHKQITSQTFDLWYQVTNQYINWFLSGPFDMGYTTRQALHVAWTDLRNQKSKIQNFPNNQERFKVVSQQIKIANKQSQSNGSLMRITPMAYFIALYLNRFPKMQFSDFKDIIEKQVSITHGNNIIFTGTQAYVQLLVELIRRKTTKKTLKTIYDQFIQKYQNDKWINEWIKEVKDNAYMKAIVRQGWAKIAFTFTLKKLKEICQTIQDHTQKTCIQEKVYKDVIGDIISRAGDTDTNAAIVGGMLGAVLGFDKLPQAYLQKQFSLRLDANDSKSLHRGQFYQPRKQFLVAMQIAQKIKHSSLQ